MCNNEKLIIDNISLANKIAYKKKRTLPKFIDIEEIKAAAYMGLVDAACKFDKNKGNFLTYAYWRINGAIGDYLRELGWGVRGNQRPVVSIDNENSPLKNTLEAGKEIRYNFIESVDASQKEREVFVKYFLDGFSLKEIADDYQVSESRVCQILTGYKNKIKKRWTKDEFWAEIVAA